MGLRRPCKRCGEMFEKTGKACKICDNCIKKKKKEVSKDMMKKKYFKTKEELDEIRSSATLAKWAALSKAYKLGKNIWGSSFTKHRLAYDMEMPLTTVLRCLALDKANKTSIRKMKAGKISPFKLAMICHSKSLTYQDEIVDMVIEDGLSTYQIKSLKINNIKDINKERHRVAVEKGYARQDVAARQFVNWIDRGKLFLMIKDKHIPKEKKQEIKQGLKKLKDDIEKYISE